MGTGRFNSWDNLYRDKNVEEMPWFHKNLDKDLAEELQRRKISRGKFLDLGTGPGTQAIILNEMGFSVIASDISKHAIRKANKFSQNVSFIQDDILKTRFDKNSFDYIFDRGCFHVLKPDDWKIYIKQIKRIIANNGWLFLKTFSLRETEIKEGPYRFSKKEIKNIFASFKLLSIKETIFETTLPKNPKALFAVMRNRK